jgi:hypothetical protein
MTSLVAGKHLYRQGRMILLLWRINQVWGEAV